MPTYCYRLKKTGELIEVHMTVRELAERQRPDGSIRLRSGEAQRDYAAERVAAPPDQNWPMKCEASGVNPSQVKQANKTAEREGLSVRFDTDGCAVYNSPAHRRKALRERGFYDKNAGFSDPTPA